MTTVEEARSRIEGSNRSFAGKAAREKRRVGCLKEESVGEIVHIPATATPMAIRQQEETEEEQIV